MSYSRNRQDQLNSAINPIEDPPTFPAVRADINVLVSRVKVFCGFTATAGVAILFLVFTLRRYDLSSLRENETEAAAEIVKIR